jgi:hypothetical protein
MDRGYYSSRRRIAGFELAEKSKATKNNTSPLVPAVASSSERKWLNWSALMGPVWLEVRDRWDSLLVMNETFINGDFASYTFCHQGVSAHPINPKTHFRERQQWLHCRNHHVYLPTEYREICAKSISDLNKISIATFFVLPRISVNTC